MLVERRVSGRILRAQCAEPHAERAATALEAFGDATGVGPGVQMRFGWSMLRLEPDGDALRATEPDFAALPGLRWIRTIDVTLDVLAGQVALLRRVGADGDDAWFDQALLAAPGALERPEVFLRRDDSPGDDDSGWVLAPLEDPEALSRADALAAILVGSLVIRRRTLLPALALPRGFVAIFSGDTLRQVLDGEGRERL